MSLACRDSCASSEPTAPMCGAIEPVAPPDGCAICIYSCARLCTAVHARPERMMESLSRWLAVFGISPCGQRMAPNVVGLKSAGVHVPSFKSHVSTWLGAPERKMRMQFLAVLCSVGLTAAADSRSLALATSAKYEPTSAVPATWKKRRRVKPSPRSEEKLPLQLQVCRFIGRSFGFAQDDAPRQLNRNSSLLSSANCKSSVFRFSVPLLR